MKKCTEYPKKGPVCGASSAQRKKPTILNVKHDLPYIEELRNIQPVDDPTVEQTTKWDVSTTKKSDSKETEIFRIQWLSFQNFDIYGARF